MKVEELLSLVQKALDDKKAIDLLTIPLAGRSAFADYFILATGTSSTHVAALADEVDRVASKNRYRVWGIEGLPSAEWVLVDLGDIIVHLFQREIREMYALEKLWSPQTLLPEEAKLIPATEKKSGKSSNKKKASGKKAAKGG
ncbi:MAG: ribosome silencing factor [Magnetococcales bacterium]|nr:ribosome silencing factor [Magnetococcales bacterium]NGZ29204.1 ribosome silencing factor [Magnetococcales bacterium]